MKRALPLCLILLTACGNGVVALGDAPDSGLPDAGEPDAGPPDSGPPDAGQPDAGLPDAGSPDAGPTGIQTVFLILLENHAWGGIKGSSSAPYINGTLLPMSAHAEGYKGALSGNLHPSEPNYLWLEAGDNLGVLNDNAPSSNHKAVTDHLVTLLEAANVSWRSYQEDIADGACPLTATGNYAPKHNPMVFFDDVIDYGSSGANPLAPRCLEHVKPLSKLATDLTAGTAARYNFITPNQCNDMHTSCAPTSNEIRQGDDWLALWVPKILASPQYQQGGALFITWDEAEAGSLECVIGNCPIGMIVLSPLGKTGNYASGVALDHSSTLKTMQEIFRVTPLLRHAGDSGVNDLRDLFVTFP